MNKSQYDPFIATKIGVKKHWSERIDSDKCWTYPVGSLSARYVLFMIHTLHMLVISPCQNIMFIINRDIKLTIVFQIQNSHQQVQVQYFWPQMSFKIHVSG